MTISYLPTFKIYKSLAIRSLEVFKHSTSWHSKNLRKTRKKCSKKPPGKKKQKKQKEKMLQNTSGKKEKKSFFSSPGLCRTWKRHPTCIRRRSPPATARPAVGTPLAVASPRRSWARSWVEKKRGLFFGVFFLVFEVCFFLCVF